MHQGNPKPLKNLLYPYMFVLMEGKEIKENLFDYSLMMMHVGEAEVIPSPINHFKNMLQKLYESNIPPPAAGEVKKMQIPELPPKA